MMLQESFISSLLYQEWAGVSKAIQQLQSHLNGIISNVSLINDIHNVMLKVSNLSLSAIIIYYYSYCNCYESMYQLFA